MEKIELQKRVETPFNQRLERALLGWQRADADRLDKIGLKIGKLFKTLTCEEVINNFGIFITIKNESETAFNETHREDLTKIVDNLNAHKTPIVNIISKLTNELMTTKNVQKERELQRDLNILLQLNLGGYLHGRFTKELEENNDPQLLARIIYLSTSIENPFIVINNDVKQVAQATYNQAKQTEHRLEPTRKEDAIRRYSTFLNETRYGANCKELNAWGYADQACKEALYLIDNPLLYYKDRKLAQVGEKFKGDIMLFCENQKCFPPQVFFILDRIKKLYPKSSNYIEALLNFYDDPNHKEGLFGYFQGQLNFTISGINRIYERIDLLSELNTGNDGAFLSLFSGPISISKAEAKLVGASECITVDSLNFANLKSVKNGGMALLLKNELLPGQNTGKVLASDVMTNIPHKHIDGTLPDDFEAVEKAIEDKRVSIISDKRGSGLYLQSKRKLDYLIKLFGFAQKHPGVIINYDTGVPNWLYVSFVLKQNNNSGYDIKDYFSGLNMNMDNKTYVHLGGNVSNFFSGNNTHVLSYKEFLTLINLNENERHEYSQFEMLKIIEALYYVSFPMINKIDREDMFMGVDQKEMTVYFKKMISGHYKDAITFITSSKMNDTLKTLLLKINPTVFNRIIHLLANKNNIYVSKEGIFYPALCGRYKDDHGYSYKETKKAGENSIDMGEQSIARIFKIIKKVNNINIPHSLVKIFGLSNVKAKTRLSNDSMEKWKGETHEDSTFFIGGTGQSQKKEDSTTTIQIHHEKSINHEIRLLRIASVVRCLDGENRILAIEYQKIEGGWLATNVNISSNDFPNNVLDLEKINRNSVTVFFPSSVEHNAGEVTDAMVKSLNGNIIETGINYYVSDYPLDFNKPQEVFSGGSVNINLKLDNEKNNYSILINGITPIVTFPARFP